MNRRPPEQGDSAVPDPALQTTAGPPPVTDTPAGGRPPDAASPSAAAPQLRRRSATASNMSASSWAACYGAMATVRAVAALSFLLVPVQVWLPTSFQPVCTACFLAPHVALPAMPSSPHCTRMPSVHANLITNPMHCTAPHNQQVAKRVYGAAAEPVDAQHSQMLHLNAGAMLVSAAAAAAVALSGRSGGGLGARNTGAGVCVDVGVEGVSRHPNQSASCTSAHLAVY